MPTYDAFPNPVYRVIDFVGEFFLYGAVGGSAFHFVRGLRRSPSGGRLAGAIDAVRANTPRVAGKFGAYCAVFSAFESAVSLTRRRADTWSAAAAATWGLHGMRRGGVAAAAAATWGLHGMLRGGAAAAARCTLLGAARIVVLTEIDQVIMVTWCRRAALSLSSAKSR